MRFRRIEDTFLAVAETPAEAVAVAALLTQLTGVAEPQPAPPTPPQPAPAPPAAIDKADILTTVSADIKFADQMAAGVYVDALGGSPGLHKYAETGMPGPRLPNGETMRFGKEPDPAKPSRNALTFQLSPGDPTTGGSKRVELGFPRNIDMDKVYWLAVAVYVHDWGTLSPIDQALFGFQLHSGSKLDLSPTISLYTAGSNGRSMQIHTRSSTSVSPSQGNTVSQKWPEMPIPFGRWMDVVVRFKQNIAGQGFAQVWLDGNLIVDHKGNLGFLTPGFKDFMKLGYYNWTSAFASPRKVRLRNPTLIADFTEKYSPATVRALLTKE